MQATINYTYLLLLLLFYWFGLKETTAHRKKGVNNPNKIEKKPEWNIELIKAKNGNHPHNEITKYIESQKKSIP